MVAAMNEKPSIFELIKNPVLLLAYGFGLGLFPKAPGTFGTLAGIPLVIIVMYLSPLMAVMLLSALFLVGIPICDSGSQRLGKDDPGAVVWDEIVGYGIAVIAIPLSIWAVVAAFVLFRIFDILKPWPIRWADTKVHGGLGIMLDDVLAGLMALAVMHLMQYFIVIHGVSGLN